MKVILANILFLYSFTSYSGDFGVMAGHYSLNSKRNQSSTTVSSFGSYRFFYHHQIRSNIIADLSYTLLFENSFGGDSSYGFDLGVNYFPFQAVRSSSENLGNIQVTMEPKYSPYFGIGYHQRQYQSISTAYSGPGIKGGAIISYSKKFNFIAELRYVSLKGPSVAEASEISTNFGVLFKY